MRIADWNIKHIEHSKSEIRNLHSEFLGSPLLRYMIFDLAANHTIGRFELYSSLLFIDRFDVELVVGIQAKTLNIFVHGGI